MTKAKSKTDTSANPDADAAEDDTQDGLLRRADSRNQFVREVSSIYVPHPRFVEILARIRTTIDTLHDCDVEPTCLGVGGPSGVGKSTLLRKLKATYPTISDGRKIDHPLLGSLTVDHVPVLIIRMPSKPSVITLGQEILKAYGDSMYWRGGRASIQARVDLLMTHAGTKALVIDEAQRIADRSGTVTAFDIVDWLRDRAADNGVILILVGLGRMIEVIRQDEQFARRYDAEIRLLPYRWRDARGRDIVEDQEDFAGILTAIADLSPIKFGRDVPITDEDDEISMAATQRFHYASQGLFGQLMHLMKHSVQLVSKEKGKSRGITLSILHSAFERGFDYRRKGMENPFTSTWQPKEPPSVEDDQAFKTPAAKRRAKRTTQAERRAKVINALTKR